MTRLYQLWDRLVGETLEVGDLTLRVLDVKLVQEHTRWYISFTHRPHPREFHVGTVVPRTSWRDHQLGEGQVIGVTTTTHSQRVCICGYGEAYTNDILETR